MLLPEHLKIVQRKAGIAARNRLEAHTASAFSRDISNELISSAYCKVDTIFSYRAIQGEVDLSLFHQWAVTAGKRLAFPLCLGDGNMVAAVPDSEDAWETGRYGIQTPIASRSRILDPFDLDLVLVPCTAFDAARKVRCGMGSGYYDRYLPQCQKAVAIAVAFEIQRIDDLQADDWDVPPDHIVTEQGWY